MVDAESGGGLDDLIPGGSEDDRDLGDIIEDGLSNVTVTEGSSGAMEWVLLLMLIVLWGARRAPLQKLRIRG